jgi:hypothetical protein
LKNFDKSHYNPRRISMTSQKRTANSQNANGDNETTVKLERPRFSREEILERKISMAKERGSRVIRINSPLGSIMYNVLRQFDQAYNHFKGKLGEPGGMSYEEGADIMEEARKITLAFSELTKELSERLGFQYLTPQELQEVQLPQAGNPIKKGQETTS